MPAKVKVGAPPTRRNNKPNFGDRYSPVVKAATNQRGEWHSMPLHTDEADAQRANIYGRAYQAVAKELGVTIAIRDDRVYIMVPK